MHWFNTKRKISHQPLQSPSCLTTGSWSALWNDWALRVWPEVFNFPCDTLPVLFPLLWPRTLEHSGPQVDFIPYIHKHPSPSPVTWVTTFPVILDRSLLVVILFSEVISAFLFFLIFCGAARYQDEISKDPKSVFLLTFRNSTWPRMISEKITTSQTTTCTRIPFCHVDCNPV